MATLDFLSFLNFYYVTTFDSVASNQATVYFKIQNFLQKTKRDEHEKLNKFVFLIKMQRTIDKEKYQWK